MEKINVAELLKDCPKGIELNCTMLDKVILDGVVNSNDPVFPIRVRRKDGCLILLTKYGQYFDDDYAKCVIFPKGKTTWEGFVPPCKFKDGDIAVSDKGDIHLLCTKDSSYCVYRERWEGLSKFDETPTRCVSVVRLATEEEKQKLFQAIKDNGYKWNSETKTLEKLIEPKFNVGDKIKKKGLDIVYAIEITAVTPTIYTFKNGGFQYIEITDKNYELVPNKFDITTLKPFDKVLVRTKNFTPTWTIDFYDGYQPNIGGSFTPFGVTGGKYFQQCIPYKGNEHLRGTTNDCDEYFKTWK